MNKKEKTSLSVPEIKKILGLQKTASYWLVKKGYFQTKIVGNQIRVMRDSFEEWYAGQFRYKKIDGTPPGKKWIKTTCSVQEIADLLRISHASVYMLIEKNVFKTLRIAGKIRIDFNSFEKWYKKQTHYKKHIARCS